jgi:cell division protein FtsN
VPATRTHYQLSFTTRQGMAFFIICLLALGLSFFLGLMAGLSRRALPVPAAPATVSAATPAATVPEVAAEVSPGTPGPPSETRLAGGNSGSGSGEPTPPAVLQTFEDRESEPTAAPSPVRRPPSPTTPVPAPSGFWVQAASLASRGEADALAARLSRHGYHAQVVAAQGPKGKVFRVRVGPYSARDDATRAGEKLQRQEKISQPWVVPEGH